MTEQIANLLKLAREEGDFVGEEAMHWFLKEQREEVSSMSDLLKLVERALESNILLAEDALARTPVGDQGVVDPSAPPARRRRALTLRAASASRTYSATASSSISAPVTSLSISSAVGRWPSDQSSRRSEPALALREPGRAELLAEVALQLRLERPRADVLGAVEAGVDVAEVVGRARLDLQRVAEDLDVAGLHRPRVVGDVELELVEHLRAVAADEVEEARSRSRRRTRAGAGRRGGGSATRRPGRGAPSASPSPR